MGLLTTAAMLALATPVATAAVESDNVECADVMVVYAASGAVDVDTDGVLSVDGNPFSLAQSSDFCSAILSCPNPGNQGRLVSSVPYLIVVDGTGWEGSNYYVFGTTYAAHVDKYNYCVSNVQVGAVTPTYTSWTWKTKVI